MKLSLQTHRTHTSVQRVSVLFAIFISLPLFRFASLAQTAGQGEIAWAIGYDPKTFDPAKVDDQASEQIRYITGGVLLRLNRVTMHIEPAIAESWTISPDGRIVTFHIRPNLRFSDGSPLTSADAAASLRRVLLPATGAPVAEEFLTPGKVVVEAPDPTLVRVRLPQRVTSVAAVFDEIAIEPAGRSTDARITAGPFVLADYRRGESLRLIRNPFYWKRAADGTPLPRLAAVRLDILNNRETEELRFARGQYAVLEDVPPDGFAALSRRVPAAMHDLGPSLNTEQMWFNQASNAPIPPWEKSWFTNTDFRMAISEAIHREDLVRLGYLGHATPANGFISPANAVWYNHALPPVREDLADAARLLSRAGFHKQGSLLVDREGHPVRFSILTNTGNGTRARMASLIQGDLARLGVQVNVVTLDFPALIDRLMHTADYEAALLGLSDVQPDPSTTMNLWLSSSPNHQWNPSENSPATSWEAEIDRLMQVQAEAPDLPSRKAAVDRVQSIVAAQHPFIYLVYPNVLCGASPELGDLHLSVLQPNVISEIDTARLRGTVR